MSTRRGSSFLIIAIAGMSWEVASGFPMPQVIFSGISGDPSNAVPGVPGGEFSDFARPARSPDGTRWIISGRVNSATVPPGTAEVVITGSGFAGPRNLLVQQGVTPIDGTRTCTQMNFDTRHAINDAGNSALSCNLDGATTDDEVVLQHVGGTLGIAAREGMAVGPLVPGWSFGDPLYSANISNSNAVSFGAQITPGTGTNGALFLNNKATLAVRTGVTVPSGMGIGSAWTALAHDSFYVSGDGTNWLARGSAAGGQIVAVNNNVVIRTGVSPGPGIDPPTLINDVVMMSDGTWFSNTSEGVGTGGEDQLIRNGFLLALTGMMVSGGMAGEHITDFGLMQGNNHGDFIYSARTDNVDPFGRSVLVFNNSVVVARSGDPVDLSGNGIFDDGVYLGVPNPNGGFLTDLREFYWVTSLQNSFGESIGNAFLMLQVPEPATFFCVGLAALAFRRRIRK